MNNIELRMPPPTLPFFQDNISFAIFHDAGNVFTNVHDMFHSLLRWSQKDPEVCLQEATGSSATITTFRMPSGSECVTRHRWARCVLISDTI